MSGRQADCRYAARETPGDLSAAGASSHEWSASPGRSQGSASCSPGRKDDPRKADPERPLTHEPFLDPSLHETVNLAHTELYVHLIRGQGMFNLAGYIGDYTSNMARGLELGLTFPYVLYQLLAFSSRHLAALHPPEQSSGYTHRAIALQTTAVSLFNAASAARSVDATNCVPVLLFCATLSYHVLADTLATLDGDLDAFLARWVHCASVHRGIYTISVASWPLLMGSELSALLEMQRAFTSRLPQGDDCADARAMLDAADDLTDEERGACREALRMLQVGFDAGFQEDEQATGRYQMIFSWGVLAPPSFSALLIEKRPEALVVMGYFALLLYYARDLWQVRDAGAYILAVITAHLDPKWQLFLREPREKMLGRTRFGFERADGSGKV